MPSLPLLLGLLLPCQVGPPRPGVVPPTEAAGPVVRGRAQDHASVPWFEGTWDEALSLARRSDRLLFVELRAEQCPYCKKLAAITLRDAQVLKELRDLLPVSLEVHAPENLEVVRHYQPTLYPTLLFLEPDGSVRDRVIGFVGPERLVEEVRRIRRNENTLSQLRSRIAADARDLDARYALAKKLELHGDERGAREQLTRIRELDPEGRSLAARRIAFEDLRRRAEGSLETTELYAFLAETDEPVLLFEGWYAVWRLEGYLLRIARRSAERSEHRRLRRAAAHELWKHLPRDDEHFVPIGRDLAASFVEERRTLRAQELDWALEVARTVAAAADDDAQTLGVLASCLHAVGRVGEARETAQRCVALEPRNPRWRKLLHELRTER